MAIGFEAGVATRTAEIDYLWPLVVLYLVIGMAGAVLMKRREKS
jgi:hypothetical protein